MSAAIDYLAIGHVSEDLAPGGSRLGGTVSFAALTAQALGRQAAIVTSAPTALLGPLAGLPLHVVPAEQATTFVNAYTAGNRVQTLHGHAAPITCDDVPPDWRSAGLVHLAPVAAELDASLARRFPGARVCVTPQGWMRRWDEAGRVGYRPWAEAADVLPHVDVLALSIEDVRGDEALAADYAAWTPVVALTRGLEGCTLFAGGRRVEVPAPAVVERDPTGAGDVFAAALFVRLAEGADPVTAARFAVALASDSVTRVGLAAIPTPAAIAAARAGTGGGGSA